MRIFFAGKADSIESKMVKESSKWIVRLGEARGEVECSMLAMRKLVCDVTASRQKRQFKFIKFSIAFTQLWKLARRLRDESEAGISFSGCFCYLIHGVGLPAVSQHSRNYHEEHFRLDFKHDNKRVSAEKYLMWRHSDILPTSELSANLFVCTNLSSCFPSSTLSSIYQFPTNFTKTSRQHVID